MLRPGQRPVEYAAGFRPCELLAADLNNDGIADPLFLIEGETFADGDGNGILSSGETFTDANGNEVWDGRIRLNLWVFKEFEDVRFTLRNYTRTWELSDVSN